MGKRVVKASDIMAKLREQDFRCYYTGDELTPDNVSADHIVALSAGGSHHIDNVCLVLSEVNRMKGTLSVERFVELCRMVVEHAERREAVAADAD